MSGYWAYVALSLAYTWGGTPELSVSPETLAWSCPARAEYTLAPLELTWSPAEGFGAKSSVQVSQGYAKPFYCQR